MKNRYEQARQDKPFKAFDVIILVVLLVLIVLTVFFALQPKGEMVKVYKSGKLVFEASVLKDFDYEVGNEISLICRDGKVSVASSSCKNGLCQSQSEIWRAGARIICLPAQISIVIQGKTDVDVVSKVLK